MLTHAGKLWWDCPCLFLLGLTMLGKRGLLHEQSLDMVRLSAVVQLAKQARPSVKRFLGVVRAMKCTWVLNEVGRVFQVGFCSSRLFRLIKSIQSAASALVVLWAACGGEASVML